jgi:hypothetical protein
LPAAREVVSRSARGRDDDEDGATATDQHNMTSRHFGTLVSALIRFPRPAPPALALALAAVAAALVVPAPARAQETPPPSPPPGETAAPPGDDQGDGQQKEKKKKKKDKAEDKANAAEASAADGMAPTATVIAGAAKVELRGRVMAPVIYERQRVEYDVTGARTNRQLLSLLVDSARFGLKVDVLDWVSVQLEAELAGRVRLRDGLVQLKRKHWLARAGQFKMPISVFTLESPWTLPLARRGWLHEILSDHMLLTGRREGVLGQLSAGGSLDPALTAGAFRSVRCCADAGDPIEVLAPDEQTVVGRLSVTPAGVELAAVVQRRVTIVAEELRGFWAAGLESTADFEFERTGLRWWLEAYAGSSWFDYAATAGADVTFVTARALLAWRWRGLTRGEPYVEPFATVGVLEPDSDATSDSFLELMGGVNVGHWRRTRLALQVEYARAQRNFPRQYFLGFANPVLVRHLAVMLMLGAAF